MNIHTLVDRFAPQVNGKLMPDINWVEELEGKVARRFPVSFHSLISRYEFSPFDCKGIFFFGNTREVKEEREELRFAIFQDKILSECLLKSGYVQFGRPDTGDYDAICFDTNQKRSNREYPIVRIDHEGILCFSQIRVTEILAPSFYKFIKSVAEAD